MGYADNLAPDPDDAATARWFALAARSPLGPGLTRSEATAWLILCRGLTDPVAAARAQRISPSRLYDLRTALRRRLGVGSSLVALAAAGWPYYTIARALARAETAGARPALGDA